MPYDESVYARAASADNGCFSHFEITMNHHVNATLLGARLLLGAASVSAIDFRP
jgi:hypothetical protein